MQNKCVDKRRTFDQVYSPKETVKKESIYLENEEEETVFEVSKALDKNLVSGWASISIQADGEIPLDYAGDIIAPNVLENAAINFMENYRASGVMHEGSSIGVIVESIVFTEEKMKAIGITPGTVPIGWFITVKIKDPEVFVKVKNGQYKMFSIQGKAKRLKV